jgi:hypothetical protein
MKVYCVTSPRMRLILAWVCLNFVEQLQLYLMSKLKISLTSAILSIIVLISFGTWAFRLFEDWSWAESFYFTVSTLTTVGYGDTIYPTSDESRVFTALFILVGVGITFTALTTIGAQYLNTQEDKLNRSITRKLARNHRQNLKK